MIPGAVPIIGGAPLPSVVWTDAQHNPNTAGVLHKSYTVNVGAEDASRYIVVGLADSGTVSNFKIGGVAATTLLTAGTDGFLFGAALPTGTTATLTWDVALGTNTEMMGVWAAYNLLSTTAFGTSSIGNDNAAPTPFNCNTPANGILVAFSYTRQLAPVTATATWTGVTEDFDSPSWRDAFSGGSTTTTVAETPRTVSVTWTTTAGAGGLAASFA